MKSLPLKSSNYRYLEQSYKQWLDTLGYAEKTVYSFPVHVREMLYYFEQKGLEHISQVQSRHIREFVHYFKQRKTKSLPNGGRFGGGCPSSSHVNKVINSINTFTKYLGQSGRHDLDLSIRQMEGDAEERTVLTRAEIMSLYEASYSPHRQNASAIGQRDRAIIAIFYGCGLRKEEGSRLNLRDVDLVKRLVFVKKGKGNKQRYVPIAAKHAEDLRVYLEEGRYWFLMDNRTAWHVQKGFKKQGTDDEAFFLNMTGKRMQTVYSRLDYLKETAGITKAFSTHSLRHSIATHLLESGMPIEDIARFLGHSSLESTQIYTHLLKQLQPAHEEN